VFFDQKTLCRSNTNDNRDEQAANFHSDVIEVLLRFNYRVPNLDYAVVVFIIHSDIQIRNAQAIRRKFKDVMHKGVNWIGPGTPVFEIAKLVREHEVGAIPIGEMTS